MLNEDQLEYLKGLYVALSKDCATRVPTVTSVGLERDVSRLFSCVERRGLRTLTVDLPDIGKHFDRCLSDGRLLRRVGPLARAYRRGSPVPRLFQELVLRVFDNDGNLRPTPCTEAIRFLRQFYYLAKKWRMKCNDSLTFNEVREFYRVDQQLRHPTLNWYGGELRRKFESAHSLSFVDGFSPPTIRTQLPLQFEELTGVRAVDTGLLLATLQRTCDFMSSALGSFQAVDWLPRHGPGVVSDLKTGNSKYEFPVWPERLDRIFPISDFAFANQAMWASAVQSGEVDGRFAQGLHYSKLIAVPKTQKGPRLIAAEPSANLWCQQIVRKYLATETSNSWLSRMIAFNDQTKNQELALAASRDGLLATIDLKSASDRMSCWVVERAFRGRYDLLEALFASRTPIIRNLIDKKSPEFYRLRKFSTMGSAVTFPIQSLVFACCALASLAFVERTRSLAKIKTLARQVRVFGDDLVVPVHAVGTLRHLFQVLGFEVNDTKTFESGNFRESCGVDAYNGVDVTPAYALAMPTKAKPESLMSSAAQAHNFASCGLWNAAEYHQWTANKIGLGFDLPYVTTDSGVLGWPAVDGDDYSHLRRRWNSSLQRLEYRMRTLIVRSSRQADRGASRLLQYFVESPSLLMKWTGGYDVRSVVLSRPRWVPAT